MTKFSKKKIKQMNNFNKLFCTACLNYFLRIERNENQKIDEFYFLNTFKIFNLLLDSQKFIAHWNFKRPFSLYERFLLLGLS
jgi:hypothetical protein